MNPWPPRERQATDRASLEELRLMVHAVQVTLWSWAWWIVATAHTTVGGVLARAWRRAAHGQG